MIEEHLDKLRIGIAFQVKVQQLTAVRVPVGRNQAGPSLTIDLTTAEQSMHFLGTLLVVKIYSGIPCVSKYCRACVAATRLAVLIEVPTPLPTTTPRTVNGAVRVSIASRGYRVWNSLTGVGGAMYGLAIESGLHTAEPQIRDQVLWHPDSLQIVDQITNRIWMLSVRKQTREGS